MAIIPIIDVTELGLLVLIWANESWAGLLGPHVSWALFRCLFADSWNRTLAYLANCIGQQYFSYNKLVNNIFSHILSNVFSTPR